MWKKVVFILGFLTCLINALAEGEANWQITPDKPALTQARGPNPAVIKVTGKTNLPNRTVLNITLYYRLSCQPANKDTPPSTESKKTLIDLKKCLIADGNYEIQFGPFAGKLPPGSYIASVGFDPTKQYKEVQEKLGEKTTPLTAEETQISGTDDDIKREKDEALRTIKKSASNLLAHLKTLKDNFITQVNKKAFDQPQWEKWLKDFTKELDLTVQPCQNLDILNVFTTVPEGRMMVIASADKLNHLAGWTTKILIGKERTSAKPYEEFINATEELEQIIQDGLDRLGLAKSVDREILSGIFREIQKHLDGFQQRLRKLPEIQEWLKEERERITELLFNLSAILGNIDFNRISTISSGLLRLWEIAESGKVDVAEITSARRQIDQALKELKWAYLEE